MTDWGQTVWSDLVALRRARPLIHNITNYVVMNSTANILLSLGASPVMAHSCNEVEEMAGHARALVLNIGTLSSPWVEAMLLAGKAANQKGIPVVLDPVGAGATSYRTATAKKILAEVNVAIVRGNAAEIMALTGGAFEIKGVDSLQDAESTAESARLFAGKLKTVLALTGPIDLITDGVTTYRVANGHPLLTKVTGTGCAATAVVASFAAVAQNPLAAAAEGLACFGLAAEVASKQASGPGSFYVALLDALAALDKQTVQGGVRVS